MTCFIRSVDKNKFNVSFDEELQNASFESGALEVLNNSIDSKETAMESGDFDNEAYKETIKVDVKEPAKKYGDFGNEVCKETISKLNDLILDENEGIDHILRSNLIHDTHPQMIEGEDLHKRIIGTLTTACCLEALGPLVRYIEENLLPYVVDVGGDQDEPLMKLLYDLVWGIANKYCSRMYPEFNDLGTVRVPILRQYLTKDRWRIERPSADCYAVLPSAKLGNIGDIEKSKALSYKKDDHKTTESIMSYFNKCIESLSEIDNGAAPILCDERGIGKKISKYLTFPEGWNIVKFLNLPLYDKNPEFVKERLEKRAKRREECAVGCL